mmetsp:Transcript_1771/g.4801  ORF Transcript_1771/g.4801 Transcript_1771/m.4801 type:complete len:85 (+) Transcript_1771:110-364(+)
MERRKKRRKLSFQYTGTIQPSAKPFVSSSFTSAVLRGKSDASTPKTPSNLILGVNDSNQASRSNNTYQKTFTVHAIHSSGSFRS